MEEFRYKFLNYLKTINYKKFIMPSFLLLINLSSFMFLFTMINRKEEKIESASKITYDAPVIEEIEKTDEETQEQEEIKESNECSNNEEKIFVDIKGSVKTPGVYELNINSRVIDAIKASGGLNKDANTNYINLSKKLEDGDVIIIYSNKEVEESQKQENIIEVPCDCSNIKNETKEEVKPSNNKININTASLEELQTLNGIGESKAALIIEYRTSNGKFKSIEELKNIKGIIEFKNIDFSYSNEKLLQNLNFIIRPNRITAITGTNGTGKTTIVDLILRLHSPTKGEILLDNINVKEIDKNSYLKEISVLNQESYLFNLSIRENFNLVENDIKKQEEMCKLTGIDKFIKTLPKGYDTIIDENSHNISGGQKRLLSLTRTLLKDAKILIFDEATSSLDTDKIQNIINVFNELKKNHTVIVITHKKEIENIADEVITIDDGKVKIKIPRIIYIRKKLLIN